MAGAGIAAGSLSLRKTPIRLLIGAMMSDFPKVAPFWWWTIWDSEPLPSVGASTREKAIDPETEKKICLPAVMQSPIGATKIGEFFGVTSVGVGGS